jgi:hypothetical protein
MICHASFAKKPLVPADAPLNDELIVAMNRSLRSMSQQDRRSQIIGDLACKHDISRDRAEMLVDRYGISGLDLECAAQNVRECRTYQAPSRAARYSAANQSYDLIVSP